MKNALKFMLGVLFLATITTTRAQEVALLTTPGTNSGEVSKTTPTAPPAANTEMTITLKNTATTNVIIFAGPKEEIRNPKVQTYGGLSKNTLYLQTNDVVCLMTYETKPMACTVVKPGTTTIEVNPSGNGIK